MAMETVQDAESIEALATEVAVSGAAASLAASAAELLSEDPERVLNRRLRGALETVRARYRGVATLQPDDALRDWFVSAQPTAETDLMAQLSSRSGVREGDPAAIEELRRQAQEISDQLTTLIEKPTKEAAQYVERTLGELSSAELRSVQRLRSERLREDHAVAYLTP